MSMASLMPKCGKIFENPSLQRSINFMAGLAIHVG